MSRRRRTAGPRPATDTRRTAARTRPRSGWSRDETAGRGQSNLLALVGALFALTTVMVLGVAVADSALADATRDAGERHAATAAAKRVVAADSSLTNRTNVLDGSAIDALTVGELHSEAPVLDGRSVRVTLDDRTVVSDGTPAGGTTVRRIVLVERTQTVTIRPEFTSGNRVTLPRRTRRVDLELNPPENVSVSTVRADDRTVLHTAAERGLVGEYTVSVSRRETVRLDFVANGSLSEGDVAVTMYPRTTTKALLRVTVDA